MVAGKAKGGSRAAFHDSEKLWSFAADVLDFCGEGIWIQFLARMKEIGYSEDEVNEMTEAIETRAGRS